LQFFSRSAATIEDLYDDFDREAPHIVKELEANLVEYITESARELGKQSFRIHFSLERTPGEAVKETRTMGEPCPATGAGSVISPAIITGKGGVIFLSLRPLLCADQLAPSVLSSSDVGLQLPPIKFLLSSPMINLVIMFVSKKEFV